MQNRVTEFIRQDEKAKKYRKTHTSEECAPKLFAVKPYLHFFKLPRGTWSIPHLAFHDGQLVSNILEAENGRLVVRSKDKKGVEMTESLFY